MYERVDVTYSANKMRGMPIEDLRARVIARREDRPLSTKTSSFQLRLSSIAAPRKLFKALEKQNQGLSKTVPKVIFRGSEISLLSHKSRYKHALHIATFIALLLQHTKALCDT